MRRVLPALLAAVSLLSVVTYAFAQDGTPTPTSGANACASPIPGTPSAATPEVSGTPEACASPVAAAPIVLDLVDIAFKPTELTIPANQDVAILLENKGLALHNFSVESLGISVDLGPGISQTITINAPAGDYDFICAIPGHAPAGMVGVIHIV